MNFCFRYLKKMSVEQEWVTFSSPSRREVRVPVVGTGTSGWRREGSESPLCNPLGGWCHGAKASIPPEEIWQRPLSLYPSCTCVDPLLLTNNDTICASVIGDSYQTLESISTEFAHTFLGFQSLSSSFMGKIVKPFQNGNHFEYWKHDMSWPAYNIWKPFTPHKSC